MGQAGQAVGIGGGAGAEEDLYLGLALPGDYLDYGA